MITATLSNPYTTRAQTVRDDRQRDADRGALLALIVTIVAASCWRQWLTQPIRRLTTGVAVARRGQARCARAGADQRLAEVAELARSFNNMADGSRSRSCSSAGDRDRSRDFLADVSHELRTPIAALRTFNELLQDGAGDGSGDARGVPGAERPADRAPRMALDQPAGAVQARLGLGRARPAAGRPARGRSRMPSSRPSRLPTQGLELMHAPSPTAAAPAARPDARRAGPLEPDRERHQVHPDRRPRGRGAASPRPRERS